MATPKQRRAAAETAEAMLRHGDRDPTDHADAIMDQICERIAAGEGLRAICRDQDMPSAAAIRRWLRESEAFRARYARAREDRADVLADEIIEIADRAEGPTAARLQVEARKWAAAKLAPKRYGEKPAPDPPGAEPKDLPNHEAAARLAAILEAVRVRMRGGGS
jgi:hypothetical protein